MATKQEQEAIEKWLAENDPRVPGYGEGPLPHTERANPQMVRARTRKNNRRCAVPAKHVPTERKDG